MKVKEDVIAELHGNVLKKDEEIASLKSLLDEQKNKNNVCKTVLLRAVGNLVVETFFYNSKEVNNTIKQSPVCGVQYINTMNSSAF